MYNIAVQQHMDIQEYKELNRYKVHMQVIIIGNWNKVNREIDTYLVLEIGSYNRSIRNNRSCQCVSSKMDIYDTNRGKIQKDFDWFLSP